MGYTFSTKFLTLLIRDRRERVRLHELLSVLNCYSSLSQCFFWPNFWMCPGRGGVSIIVFLMLFLHQVFQFSNEGLSVPLNFSNPVPEVAMPRSLGLHHTLEILRRQLGLTKCFLFYAKVLSILFWSLHALYLQAKDVFLIFQNLASFGSNFLAGVCIVNAQSRYEMVFASSHQTPASTLVPHLCQKDIPFTRPLISS